MNSRIHAQTTANVTADTISRQLKDFTYKFHTNTFKNFT